MRKDDHHAQRSVGRRYSPLKVAGFISVVVMLASLLGIGLCGGR